MVGTAFILATVVYSRKYVNDIHLFKLRIAILLALAVRVVYNGYDHLIPTTLR